jgi:hypothetical protein
MNMNVSKYRDFYKTEWDSETALSDDQLSSYIIKACDNIANALFILSVDNARIPTKMSDTFCRAVCAETDFIIQNGTSEEITAEYDSIQIGSFRMSGIKNNTAAVSAANSGISSRTEEYLIKTGLLARTVCVV